MDWLFPWLSREEEQQPDEDSIVYKPFWLTQIKVKPLRRLGRGSFGVVYMAKVVQVREGYDELDVGDRVAIKVIEYQEAAREEIEIYQEIKENDRSVRICSIASCLYDFKQRSDGRFYIAYQLLDYAMDIANVVTQLNTVPRNDATRLLRMKIVKEIALTVGILHTVDIYHRDLKPANLVMGELLHHKTDDMLETWSRVGTLTGDPKFDESGLEDSNFMRYLKLKRRSVEIDPVAETTFVDVFVVDPLVVKVIDLGQSVFSCHRYSKDDYFGSQLLKDPWYYYILKNTKVLQEYNKKELERFLRERPIARTQPFDPLKEVYINTFEDQYPTDRNLERCDIFNAVWKSMDIWSLGITLYNVFHGHFPYLDFTMRGKKWYVENTSMIFLRVRPKIGVLGNFSKGVVNDLQLFHENFEDVMADMAVVIDYKDLGDGFLEFEKNARTVRRGHILVPDRRLIRGAKHVDRNFDQDLYLEDYTMIEPIGDLLQVYPLDRIQNVLQFASELEIDLDEKKMV